MRKKYKKNKCGELEISKTKRNARFAKVLL